MENPKKKSFLDLRKKAENKLSENKGTSQDDVMKELQHELSVHEVELTMQNIELIKTQVKLKSALNEFEELFEFSPQGYFILDIKGGIKKINEIGCIQFGISKAKLINQQFSIFINGEADQDEFYRYRNLALQTEEETPVLFCEIKRKNGTVFSSLIKCTVIKDEQNKFKYLLLMLSDITDIKNHEREIQSALKKSKELNELQSRFITVASHEFRTPLTVILSSANLAEQNAKQGNEDNMKKHLNRIRSSINEIKDMLDEFLSLEKLENALIESSTIKFNLPDFCANIIENMNSLTKKGQHINYSHTGNENIIGEIKILQNILIYLLSNASKYSSEDKEIDFASIVTTNTVKISIRDYGIGIPKNEQENLFNKFFRAKNAINIKGAGLELYIVKRYLDLIKGTIDFKSKINEGTTFHIQFPLNN